MNTLNKILVASILSSGAMIASAADGADPLTEERPGTPVTTVDSHAVGTEHKGHMDMKTMDTNADGMLSKDEYMAKHAAKYDRMSKNANGMVDLKDMEKSMHHGEAKCGHGVRSSSSS